MEEEFYEGYKGSSAVKDYIDVTLEEYKTLRDEALQCSINIFSVLSIGLGVIGVILAVGFKLIGDEKISIGLFIFYLVAPVLATGMALLVLGEVARMKGLGDYICFIEVKLSLFLEEFCNKKIERNWTSWQEQIRKKLALPRTLIDLSNPLAWERWLRSPSTGENCKESSKENFSFRDFVSCFRHLTNWEGFSRWVKRQFPVAGHLHWRYASHIGLFGILSFISYFIGVYYTFTKGLLALLAIVVPLFIAYLLVWIVIYVIGRKLAAKTPPIVLPRKKPSQT